MTGFGLAVLHGLSLSLSLWTRAHVDIKVGSKRKGDVPRVLLPGEGTAAGASHPTKEHLELKPLKTVVMRPLMMAWVPLPPKNLRAGWLTHRFQ